MKKKNDIIYTLSKALSLNPEIILDRMEKIN
jgi:hypothetical protein